MANEDKATRYHRLRRRASMAASCVVGALLLVLLVSGGAVWVRSAVEQLAGRRWLATCLYVTVLGAFAELLSLPFAYYQGIILERRYGLAVQTTAMWWIDWLKSTAISFVLAILATLVVTLLLRLIPDYWWIAASFVFAAVLVGVAQLAPVLLMPIFFRFRPLDRPALTERLLALSARARADVVGVFEWQLGDRTRKANAALAGLGRTRRILLSDTLLAAHSDEEIEVILAHELAHHVHRDLWTAIALDSVLIAAGFYVADRVLSVGVSVLGMTGKDDLAVLPLLALAIAVVSMLLHPLAHAISRAHERRADRYALEMTQNPAAFVSAMKRLAAQNLAEEAPSRWVEWMFHSHPSTSARIAAAQEWAALRPHRGNV
jgi:STE24 endopeptidase